MKTARKNLIAPTLALFGTLLFSGCYTQFVLSDSDSDVAADPQPVYVDQPIVLPIDFPGPILIAGPLYPTLPIAASGSGPAVTTPTQPKRNSGAQRVPPVPTIPSPPPSAPAPVTVSPSPAPSAPAPARAPESRPASGGSRR
jgi:hypothetical protein